jgi:hypothetical protein
MAWIYLALLLLPLAWAGPAPGGVYALVVGINNYRSYPEIPPLPGLNYAESDARKFAKALGSIARLRLLLDDEATKNALEAELRDLARRLGPTDTLVVYYAGHGLPNSQGQASLIPSDARVTDEETWLPLERLQAIVRQYSQGRGRLVLILDACFSGQSQVGSRSFTPPGDYQPAQAPQVEEQNALLASSSETQPSWEDDEVGGGVFTAFLLEAMSGKGDTNNDGYVTLEEAFVYLAGRVEGYSRQKGKSQTPRLYGPGDVRLVHNPIVVTRNRLGNLLRLGQIQGEAFDALMGWLEAPKLPEDFRLYLEGTLGEPGFVLLVRSGAIPKVPADPRQDKRLVRIGGLRLKALIRRDQFWPLAQMISAGKAPKDVSDYLAGRLSEKRFVQRVWAGAIMGVPR